MNIETTFFLFLWYCVWNYREIFYMILDIFFTRSKNAEYTRFFDCIYFLESIDLIWIPSISYHNVYFVNNIFLNFNIKDKILGVIIISYDPIQILCISSTFKICYWIWYYYVTIFSLNHISKFMHLLYSI